eukprot:TRINITY_DN29313_c0_g1_i1.p1 TRINITY_DN29313_c0_g1~~TRINITY_DN29313_c0_g1_i1.p1  ORF type:complete len:229 (+),score=31.27 TRINITY_DN29313_c0_g1_i1:48-734(+)
MPRTASRQRVRDEARALYEKSLESRIARDPSSRALRHNQSHQIFDGSRTLMEQLMHGCYTKKDPKQAWGTNIENGEKMPQKEQPTARRSQSQPTHIRPPSQVQSTTHSTQTEGDSTVKPEQEFVQPQPNRLLRNAMMRSSSYVTPKPSSTFVPRRGGLAHNPLSGCRPSSANTEPAAQRTTSIFTKAEYDEIKRLASVHPAPKIVQPASTGSRNKRYQSRPADHVFLF